MNSEEWIDAFKTVPHTDSRRMQPLPWKRIKEEKCDSMVAANGKVLATFFGSDERHPKDFNWCTRAQRERHIEYAIRACNSLPLVYAEMEKLYNMPGMPQAAKQAIEEMMSKIYIEDIPPNTAK